MALIASFDGTITRAAIGGDDASDTVATNAVANEPLFIARLTSFNGGTWDRVRSGGTNADGQATNTIGAVNTRGFNYIYNGVTWDRWTGAVTVTSGSITVSGSVTVAGATADNADAVATTTNAALRTRAEAYGFNGTTWDRVRSGANNADGVTALSLGVVATAAYGFAFNNSTWDRLRTNSAANISAANPIGLQVAPVGNWSINHAPNANVIATITKAAVAGQRHVCTSIAGYLDCLVAAGATVRIRLRDGATGAGTVLWAGQMCAAGAGAGFHSQVELSNLAIFGSVNTAMTLEMDALPSANATETVSLTGYTTA